MTTLVRIEVTPEDVAAGRPCHSTCCPVSHAARRVLPAPNGAPINVDTSTISYGDWCDRKHARLPEWVGDRISAYDQTGVMELPLAFDVEVES